jgi:hypothetical protein
MNAFDAVIDHATRGTWVARSADNERQRDARWLLVETQLAAESLLRLDPTNAALRTLKNFLDGGISKLDGETK